MARASCRINPGAVSVAFSAVTTGYRRRAALPAVWGYGVGMGGELAPFTVSVAEDALDDLRQRLARARWPEPATVADWSQGVPLDWLRDLCGYWKRRYDWRRLEARLNALPQFTTELDGLDPATEARLVVDDNLSGSATFISDCALMLCRSGATGFPALVIQGGLGCPQTSSPTGSPATTPP